MVKLFSGEENYTNPGAGKPVTSMLLRVGPVRRLRPYYSYLVRFLKVILPVVAVLLVLLVVAWPYIQKNTRTFPVSFSSGEIVDADKPTMINPRYTGLDAKRLPFSITADIARNMILDSTRVDLEMPKADITLSDGSWLLITAREGVYSRTAEVLDLSGDVNLFHDQGYEIMTETVHIDLLAGTAESASPVGGHGPIGDLQSEGFRMNKNTQVIYFTGKASLRLYPGALGTQEQDQK